MLGPLDGKIQESIAKSIGSTSAEETHDLRCDWGLHPQSLQMAAPLPRPPLPLPPDPEFENSACVEGALIRLRCAGNRACLIDRCALNGVNHDRVSMHVNAILRKQ